jgi:nucleotide-binding universal stress UspA family protein
MSDIDIELDVEAEVEKRFSILICIDGSEESYSGLRYAVRMGSDNSADLTLLYVRPVDQGLSSGGLQMRVARENMLKWGVQLPGTKALKRGRDMLVEMGYMGEDWKEQVVHTDVTGDPLGDNTTVYRNDEDASISLKLLVSPSVDRGILDECEVGGYDIAIISMSETAEAKEHAGYISPATTFTVATQHRGTVLVARELEEDHGHFMCVDFSDKAIQAAVKDAQIAARCHCPVHLYSVASNEDELEKAKGVVAKAKAAIEAEGLSIAGESVEIGDPVESIVGKGRKYSLIVLADTSVKGLRRFFTTSVAYEVLQKAANSVMIVR